jgi:hypothetical protein
MSTTDSTANAVTSFSIQRFNTSAHSSIEHPGSMEYTALDPSQRQIRLLHLHAGNPKDDVVCHFSIISLDNHDVEYEALSYVWGDTTEGCVVTVEGIHMPVTDNLWQALNKLRYPDKERILWVDALCINQDDDDERSDQVSHMNAVYTCASTVEIWLGEAYEGIETALRFFKDFSTGLTAEGTIVSYAHSEGAIPDDYDPDASDEELLDQNGREIMSLMYAVCEFAYKPWFRRVWTVQEFFLARKSTFHCGVHTVDGAVLEQTLYHLAKHNKFCCAVSIPFGLQIALNNFFLSTQALRTLRVVRMSFLDCVSGFRFRKATNPRDKIYGLMGLGVGEGTNLVRPDYTLPVERVFEDFVTTFLHRTGNLDILSHLRNEQPQGLVLPTFVPDWSMDLSDLDDRDRASWLTRCSILDIYDAAHGRTVKYEAHPGALRVRGAVVDTVKTIANRTLDVVQDVRGPASAWNEFLDEVMQIAGVPPREKDMGLAKRMDFWLMMIAGIAPQLQMLPSNLDDTQPTQQLSDLWDRVSGLETDLHEGYEKLLRNFNPRTKSENLIPDAFYAIDYAFGMAQGGRKFMITEHGRMGLVARHAKEGDVVAVLTGGRVPMILRPSGDFFTVVGDAYVHGIMDGEAIQDAGELDYIELR